MKKYRIWTLVAIGTLIISGCGNQQTESVKNESAKANTEEKDEEKKSQSSVEDFCKAHGITIKEEGFSYENVNVDTGDLVTENTSTTEIEEETLEDTSQEENNVESSEDVSETEKEIPLIDKKDVLSEEDWNIISMFIPDVNKASIHSEKESYESFDVIQITDKRRILVDKKILYKENTNYYSGEVNFNTKIADTRIEKLDNDVDCLVMETEIGDIYKIFYTDGGRMMWQIDDTSIAWEE